MSTRGDEGLLDGNELTLDQALQLLDEAGHEFPEAAIRTIQQHQQAATLLLVASVREAITSVQKDDPVSGRSWFALTLLTEFGAKELMPEIRVILDLPSGQRDRLMGGWSSEVLPRAMALFSDVDEIVSLAQEPSLEATLRSSILSTLRYLVRDEVVSREAAIELVMELLRSAVKDDGTGGEWPGFLVIELDCLGARQHYQEIADYFDQGCIDEFFVDLDSLTNINSNEFHPFEIDCVETRVKDTVEELCDWACFNSTWASDTEEVDSEDDDDVDPLYAKLFGRLMREARGEELPVSELVEPSELPESGTIRNEFAKVGRNQPCPCNSGKKFKKCCGRVDATSNSMN